MRGKTIVPVLALAGALVACGSSTSDTTSRTTLAPSSAGPSAVTPIASTASADKDAPVRIHQTALGRTLTDAAGKTLYSFDKDKDNPTSQCTGDCATTWPPLLLRAQGDVTVAGLPKPIGTIVRPDGGIQATYRGLPLYTFAQDSAPGDTKGDGVKGVWHAVLLPSATSPVPTATHSPEVSSRSGSGYGY
jgi:predicted lipoprotein with Yx(FWY)xxD motif